MGLHLILTTNEFAFKLIQFLGSFFLLILGILFIIDKNNELKIDANQNNFNSFFQGLIIAIVNPKILIWFAAIYSQFINLNYSFFTNSILIFTASLIDAIWYIFVAIIVTSYGFKEFFQKRKLIIQKISGFILIFISILLIYKLFNN